MPHTFEPGRYRARVTRWGLTKAKTGTPQFALTFLPIGKINPHNPDSELLPCAEVERTIFRSITDKSAQWLLQDLEQHFGYTDKRFSPLDPEHAEAFDLSQKEFTAVLVHEDYRNADTGEVIKPNVERWNFPLGAGLNSDPMNPTEIRQLDTLFGSAKPKKNGRKRQPASPTDPTTTVTGKDVPI